ncbi:MAG: S8 family serine peptidase [Bacteroidales bacterium]|nr:S8 family serine peptidase [Bacteroidales bacterium]
MKQLSILLVTFLFAYTLHAQEQKHVVFLTDKNNNPYTLSDPTAFLTQRSLDRRTNANIALDAKDLPVTPSYVDQIRATGAPVVYSLKWFNAVVVNTNDPIVLASIEALPFVDHIDQVLSKNAGSGRGVSGVNKFDGIPPYAVQKPLSLVSTKSTGSLDYGLAYNQTHMLSLDGLHDLGYTGEGMMIAILDAGFFHVDQISAFDSLWLNNQILGTRDFNIPGSNVFGDDMHTHGMMVLSTIGANLPGEMVGTAPHASFWLIHTEVGEYEALIEEYNWAAGAEFADSVGADVINSSLGYTTFDNPVYDHTYADMDGNTTPVTRAADLATSCGMMVVNSAGNSGGSSWQYIGAPADGDSVFSIGAVNAAGLYASFSSTGPTSDGRIKPDVMAQGQDAAIVAPWGGVATGNGTSFSSPIMAGAMACLWQSAPDYTAQELRDAVRNTASLASAPDMLYGYGIPNFLHALFVITASPEGIEAEPSYALFPVPFTSAPWLKNNLLQEEEVSVAVLTITGQIICQRNLVMNGSSAALLNDFSPLPTGLYIVRIISTSGQQVLRAVKQ